MARKEITINIPSEILPIVAKKKSDIPSKVLEYLIIELYRLGEISSGKAAHLLNMGRFEFVRFTSRLGIPFIDVDREELSDDYKQSTKQGNIKCLISILRRRYYNGSKKIYK